MKIQCSCGAKVAFEVTPDMGKCQVQFICPTCGRDASDVVNELVRQELGLPAAGAAPGTGASPPAESGVRPSRVVAAPTVRVRLHSTETPQGAVAVAESEAPARCAKHPQELVVERCRVCSKPICPKCMELFGYVCSPLCRAKAESQGLEIPTYAGQRMLVEARRSGWVVRGAAAVVVAVLGATGLWFWYAWFGSLPKTVFSVRFPERSYSGEAILCGPDQLVLLHGGTLARYDLKTKSQAWSSELIDHKQIEAAIDREIKRMQVLIQKANNENPEHVPKMPAPEKLARAMEREAAAALNLRVHSQNVWVASPGKLARYDWATGQPVKDVALDERFGPAIPCGDEVLVMGLESGKPVVTHVNLNTCDSTSQEIRGTVSESPAASDSPPASGGKAPAGIKRSPELAGLPTGMPGKDAGKALDPAKVAEQAQHLPLPARIALPALLAGNLNQERALAELEDQAPRASAPGMDTTPQDRFFLVPVEGGFVQVSVRLLERKLVSRSAMKAPPAKSALDGAVTMAKTSEVANELLNEMQRSRGGDVVTEDESRYQVVLRRVGGQGEWSGEVTGQPALYPLKPVNVLTANKRLMVFDQSNRKLWQSALNFNVTGGPGAAPNGDPAYGQGPCVAHKDGLYVFDEGVLTAFDLATGNVRWRLPSVGIAGLFFDDKDMLYVNTTTASPERIKYSRQIDISQKAVSVVLKIDSRTGRVLWSVQPGGLVTYVSGPYVYTVQAYQPEDEEDENPYTPDTGFETPPYLRIKRLNPKTGHELWEHFQQRAPLDVRFDRNRIALVFRKEVQVLRCLTF